MSKTVGISADEDRLAADNLSVDEILTLAGERLTHGDRA